MGSSDDSFCHLHPTNSLAFSGRFCHVLRQPNLPHPRETFPPLRCLTETFLSISVEQFLAQAMRSLKLEETNRNIDTQFHNLSEKRRRSKINEKMKALQKLILNSNNCRHIKSHCFDEAIKYLTLLQLQVQTLAVMNGLGLNPQRLPPVLPPTQTRINGTLEQDLNFGTLLGASHSLVNRHSALKTTFGREDDSKSRSPLSTVYHKELVSFGLHQLGCSA
ncbi:hypothetical protein HID58_014918 [Brassica napus]|uniref:BHLH domain-containing protein n=1 Tax=Brassica napus TaxID=3708 RepID=A0ABQ8DIH6_BRANA|nr:hypothetical protein HID58_014918 [Brassica napus]